MASRIQSCQKKDLPAIFSKQSSVVGQVCALEPIKDQCCEENSEKFISHQTLGSDKLGSNGHEIPTRGFTNVPWYSLLAQVADLRPPCSCRNAIWIITSYHLVSSVKFLDLLTLHTLQKTRDEMWFWI